MGHCLYMSPDSYMKHYVQRNILSIFPRPGTPPPEQSAWAWVDKIEDPEKDIGRSEIVSAYKLNYPGHVFQESKCKKNCKANPKCYIGKKSTVGSEYRSRSVFRSWLE